MREIALDTETTGLDPYSGHRIVEIGAVEMHNRIRTGNHYHIYLNPQRDMPAEAEKVHGLSEAFLADKPLFKDIADSFLEFIGRDPLVIHNAAFDMKFINAELEWLGKRKLSMTQAIDTVQMARSKFPGQPANLDALCRRFGIDLSARTKHGALLDAELLADVYLELHGGRQSGLALQAEETKTKQSVEMPHSYDLPDRVFEITEAERKAHQQFIEQLKDPVWAKL
jgi:DNA polymerase-3 subunit epsilon